MLFSARRCIFLSAFVALLAFQPLAASLAHAQNQMIDPQTRQPVGSYSQEEINTQAHNFFGGLTQDLANLLERAFKEKGRPNGYILGEEASAAFLAGLRYGEGTLYTKNDGTRKVFWQGPSIGLDYGGSGSKVMVLVYNLTQADDVFRTYGAIEGQAFIVGGAGITYLQSDPIIAAPVRTGVGLRLGFNAGYLKMTRKPTWNPF